jgi:hypothetical protein
MSDEIEDLWGELPTERIATPVAVLRRQATLLNEKTSGLLGGRLGSEPATMAGEKGIFNRFYITAPSLSNFSVEILRLFTPTVLYPCYLKASWESKMREIADDQALKEGVYEILRSEKVRAIVRSLLAQIHDSPAGLEPLENSTADEVEL